MDIGLQSASMLALRTILLASAMLSLVAAAAGGLVRLGWSLPVVPTAAVAAHGPLIVGGFLGTVIGLERAVGLGQAWSYAAPLLTALAALALLAGLPPACAPVLALAGSAILAAVFLTLLARRAAPSTATMALGAFCWFAGNALWLAGRPVYELVWWWMAFLALTIAGERLELARVLRLSAGDRTAFAGALAILLGGLVAGRFTLDGGTRAFGIGLAAIAAFLLRRDLAWRTVRHEGLPRFIAVSLLSGYVWLALSGLLALATGFVPAGPRYDAVLHAFFLGFVFAMIFAHAPIIFPSVLGRPIAFSPRFYVHVVLLHVTLTLRVIGDLAGVLPARHWGGMLNAATVLVFIASTAAGLLAPSASAGQQRARSMA
jgi:hypothetical protein